MTVDEIFMSIAIGLICVGLVIALHFLERGLHRREIRKRNRQPHNH